MMKIQLGGTVDPLERMLMALVEDWDEIERWAIKNNYCDERLKIAREEKESLLASITILRETERMG